MKILDPTIYYVKQTSKEGEQYLIASATAVVIDFGNEMSVRIRNICCNDIQEARNKFRVQLESICAKNYDNFEREIEKYKWLQDVCKDCKIVECTSGWYYRRTFQQEFIENPSKVYEIE